MPSDYLQASKDSLPSDWVRYCESAIKTREEKNMENIPGTWRPPQRPWAWHSYRSSHKACWTVHLQSVLSGNKWDISQWSTLQTVPKGHKGTRKSPTHPAVPTAAHQTCPLSKQSLVLVRYSTARAFFTSWWWLVSGWTHRDVEAPALDGWLILCQEASQTLSTVNVKSAVPQNALVGQRVYDVLQHAAAMNCAKIPLTVHLMCLRLKISN